MDDDLQFKVAKLLLSKIEDYGFVLSGARALKELGISPRPTQDLDFFTNEWEEDRFAEAIALAVQALSDAGFMVETVRLQKSFAQLKVVHEKQELEIDFGYDFREDPPATLSIGQVLSEQDAILNKISALYSRSLARDFIDLYYIRLSGRMSDDKLLALSRDRDEGFVLPYFIESLRKVETLSIDDFAEYEITHESLQEIKRSALDWANAIEAQITATI